VFGGERLRVACLPGANTFYVTPGYTEGGDPESGSCDGSPTRITINIAEGKVTPVRGVATAASDTIGAVSKKVPVPLGSGVTLVGREVHAYDYEFDVACGEPQPYYDVSSMIYRYKDGFRILWMANVVSTMVIEGKGANEVEELKQRLDRAHSGLNLGNPADREEFKKRYYQDSPKQQSPRGCIVRCTTLNGLTWLAPFVLTD
jgi:hypothetical protein